MLLQDKLKELQWLCKEQLYLRGKLLPCADVSLYKKLVETLPCIEEFGEVGHIFNIKIRQKEKNFIIDCHINQYQSPDITRLLGPVIKNDKQLMAVLYDTIFSLVFTLPDTGLKSLMLIDGIEYINLDKLSDFADSLNVDLFLVDSTGFYTRFEAQ